MPSPTSYPLIRGRRMRITEVDNCGTPVVGGNMAVTKGFISVGFTANTNEIEAVEVINANGETCASEPSRSEFTGYGLELTFCDVDPCIFGMLTGQPTVTNADDEVVGFRMNSKISTSDYAFALELWTGVPGVACEGIAGAFGYLLLPFVRSGVIGDFTIENAAVNFVISGASSQDGTGWGVGPYSVVPGVGGVGAAPLPEALDAYDHLYQVYTTVEPPEPTDGCEPIPTTP